MTAFGVIFSILSCLVLVCAGAYAFDGERVA